MEFPVFQFAHCLLSFHWAPLRRVWLQLLYSLPSCVYIHGKDPPKPSVLQAMNKVENSGNAEQAKFGHLHKSQWNHFSYPWKAGWLLSLLQRMELGEVDILPNYWFSPWKHSNTFYSRKLVVCCWPMVMYNQHRTLGSSEQLCNTGSGKPQTDCVDSAFIGEWKLAIRRSQLREWIDLSISL